MGHHVLVSSSLRPRRTAGLLVALLLVLGLPLVLAGPASAHARFVSISPAAGATLTTPPTKVSVTFDDTVTSGLSVVTVTGPTGAHVMQGKAVEAGSVVSQSLIADLPGGTYQVLWKIVSDDGHPVSGRSTFTVQTSEATPLTSASSSPPTSSASTSSSSTPVAAAPSTTPASSSGSGGGRSGATSLLYLLALAAVVYGVLGIFRARRKQRVRAEGTHGS